MSDVLRIETGVSDRSRMYNDPDIDIALRFREYRRLPRKRKIERPGRNVLDHMSIRSTCYQLSRALNGSVYRQFNPETHKWIFYERRQRPTINVNSGKYQRQMKKIRRGFLPSRPMSPSHVARKKESFISTLTRRSSQSKCNFKFN